MNQTEIILRWQSGQSVRAIKRDTGYDRETITKYINEAVSKGVSRFEKLTSEEITTAMSASPTVSPQVSAKTDLLAMHAEELKGLITSKSNPLKPKSAFEVLCERYGLTGQISYTTFKRFCKTFGITKQSIESTCRVIIPVGSQIQVDYGKVGFLTDSFSGKRKTVYAFIGTLGYSRHKYVEFVFSQNEQSFVHSHVKMFEYFCGVPDAIRIDNLKSGVIKPDLYDPQLNRSYSEMAQHYGVFIDVCRVATPKDKPIVERDVQTIREEFRKMVTRKPNITIAECNVEIKLWLKEVYGQRIHGTTQQKPYECFLQEEHPALKEMPCEAFEAALWKEAKVHPDHYIQVCKKSYSIPHAYVGRKVWAKVTRRIVYIYYNNELIKQHMIPAGYRATDLNDFPENMQHALDAGMPFYLRKKAGETGPIFQILVTQILAPHAQINMRTAQNLVHFACKYPAAIIEEASSAALEQHGTVHPKLFKSIIEKIIQKKSENQSGLPLSEETRLFTRKPDYYDNNK